MEANLPSLVCAVEVRILKVEPKWKKSTSEAAFPKRDVLLKDNPDPTSTWFKTDNEHNDPNAVLPRTENPLPTRM